VLLLVEVLGRPAFPTIQRIRLAVIGLAPAALLAGLLDGQLARTSVSDLFMELRYPGRLTCVPPLPGHSRRHSRNAQGSLGCSASAWSRAPAVVRDSA
jgi:hypothetical protein